MTRRLSLCAGAKPDRGLSPFAISSEQKGTVPFADFDFNSAPRLLWLCARAIIVATCASTVPPSSAADSVSLGGFLPLVGIGLTDQFDTFDSDPNGTFFIADPSFSYGGAPLGPGSSAFFDLALVDTGAATHILTQQAAGNSGFQIQAEGFRGTNFQPIFGASGTIDLRINDPLGVYAAGLADRTSAGASLTMNTSAMRGQTSFALLEGSAEWELPNVLGLPMAAHHAISIRNDQPQLFQHQGRTVRTPNVNLIELGSGPEQGIQRRTNLKLRPSAGFIQGPIYVQNFDILGGNLNFHDNPLSPSVIDSGAILIEIDMANGSRSIQDKDFLFDTGADLTVVSQLTAARLGFDVLLDEPDFVLEVEGAGGVTPGIPGFYVDELNIDTVGGSFTLQNVPVAVLDLPNPSDPANTVDGILGMHVFNGRNIVIDADIAAIQGGTGPRLYISDPVTETHTWTSTVPQTDWATAANWTAPGVPSLMWVAELRNALVPQQFVDINTADAEVFQLILGATPSNRVRLQVAEDRTLTTFGETRIEAGGELLLLGGKLDAQFVNIEGGALTGRGDIFVGSGPLRGVVRNISGRVDPGTTGAAGELAIDGDYSQLVEGTLAIQIGGTTPITQYDRLAVGRNAILDGTLEVDLSGFSPSAGAEFTILTAGDAVFGEFDNLLLPPGFLWDVAYNPNSVVLSVLGLGLAGDYNSDGAVDAADYIVWRECMEATSSSLVADGNGDQLIDHEDYEVWRSNFGRTVGEGASASSGLTSVPEPSSLLLCLVTFVVGVVARRR